MGKRDQQFKTYRQWLEKSAAWLAPRDGESPLCFDDHGRPVRSPLEALDTNLGLRFPVTWVWPSEIGVALNARRNVSHEMALDRDEADYIAAADARRKDEALRAAEALLAAAPSRANGVVLRQVRRALAPRRPLKGTSEHLREAILAVETVGQFVRLKARLRSEEGPIGSLRGPKSRRQYLRLFAILTDDTEAELARFQARLRGEDAAAAAAE